MRETDVVIAGSGPAGTMLAGECARLGLSVICVSPTVGAAWERCFGLWACEVPEYLIDCVEASWAAPTVQTWSRGERLLNRRYARLDVNKLQAKVELRATEAGVEFIRGVASGVVHSEHGSMVSVDNAEPIFSRFFVDATGGSQSLRGGADHKSIAFQTAYGEEIEVESHPFEMGEMVFMDLRHLGANREGASPSFLYAMPLSKTRIFVEETTLISEPEMSIEELKSRLKDRLRMWGVVPKKRLAVERCRIPMTFPLPDRKQRSLAFGAAASMVHPATGYLLARTIRKAPEVAAAISEEIGKGGPAKDSVSRIWREIWPIDDVRKWELYAFGANFMTKLNGDQLERFFDTFFDLPTEDWHGFMTGEMSAAGVARVMTKVFVTIDSSLRWRLLVESVGVNGGPLLRAAVAH